MKHKTLKLSALFAVLIIISASACLRPKSKGACHGYSPTNKVTYCYDDWKEKECQEWDDMKINDAEWSYSPDSTCFDIGIQPSYP